MSDPDEPDPARSDATPPPSIRVRPKRGAALALALSGLAMVVGSSMTWHADSSGFLMSIVSVSGVDLPAGLLTAEIGLVLALVGLVAWRQGGTSPFRTDVFLLAMLALVIVGAYGVRTYAVPDDSVYTPNLGAFVVALAAAMAAVASRRLPPPNEAHRAWANLRRPAFALLMTAAALWWLALSGQLGGRVAPLAYAIVLAALAVGMWPTRIRATRVAPATIGMLVLLYGALALGAVLFFDVGGGFLAASPIALLLVVVVPAVLELPVETPSPRSKPDRIDIALRAARSSAGLMIAALLLTVVTVLLVGLAALGVGDLPFGARLMGRAVVDRADPLPMLGAGLAITVGIATDVLRRYARGREMLLGPIGPQPPIR